MNGKLTHADIRKSVECIAVTIRRQAVPYLGHASRHCDTRLDKRILHTAVHISENPSPTQTYSGQKKLIHDVVCSVWQEDFNIDKHLIFGRHNIGGHRQ